MKVAVVGGAGFIGRHVVRRLLDSGATVFTVDREAAIEPETGERFIRADVSSHAELTEAIGHCAGVHAVIWLAANIRQSDDVDGAVQDDLSVSVEVPLRFLRGVQPSPAAFAYASSVQVYGRPRYLPVDEDHALEPFTAYGVAKLCGERYIAIAGAARGMSVVNLRLAFVYGPGQHSTNVLPTFIAAVRAGEAPVVRGDGNEVRDDIHVDDVADCFMRAIERRAVGAFNVASGTPHTLLDIAESVCRVAGSGLEPRFDPNPSVWVDRWYAIDRARACLGFTPKVKFETAMREIWNAG